MYNEWFFVHCSQACRECPAENTEGLSSFAGDSSSFAETGRSSETTRVLRRIYESLRFFQRALPTGLRAMYKTPWELYINSEGFLCNFDLVYICACVYVKIVMGVLQTPFWLFFCIFSLASVVSTVCRLIPVNHVNPKKYASCKMEEGMKFQWHNWFNPMFCYYYYRKIGHS